MFLFFILHGWIPSGQTYMLTCCHMQMILVWHSEHMLEVLFLLLMMDLCWAQLLQYLPNLLTRVKESDQVANTQFIILASSSNPGSLSLSAVDIEDQIVFSFVSCLVHCVVFSRLPGLYPLSTSRIPYHLWQPDIFPDVANVPLGTELSPLKNHWSNQLCSLDSDQLDLSEEDIKNNSMMILSWKAS